MGTLTPRFEPGSLVDGSREDWSPIGRKRLAPYARNLTLKGRTTSGVLGGDEPDSRYAGAWLMVSRLMALLHWQRHTHGCGIVVRALPFRCIQR